MHRQGEESERPGSASDHSTLAPLALVTLGLLVVLCVVFVGRQGDRLSAASETSESGALAPAGDCLGDVAPIDVRPGRYWRSFWKRLDASDCRPHSWLTRYSEQGQSLEEFRGAERTPVGAGQTLELFALTPLSDEVTSALLPITTQFLGLYFQESVRVSPGRALPPAALRSSEGSSSRYDAAALLEGLAGPCPADASACLAVTDQDLTLKGLRYLFGLGRPQDRLGVMSTFRLGADVRSGAPGGPRVARSVDRLRRALKVAAHEVGHQLGLAHCRHFADCVMAGSGSLEEIDDRHLMLCPLEHAKLGWKLGFSSAQRFADLAQFAAEHGLHREAAYWIRMADAAPPYSRADGAVAP